MERARGAATELGEWGEESTWYCGWYGLYCVSGPSGQNESRTKEFFQGNEAGQEGTCRDENQGFPL